MKVESIEARDLPDAWFQCVYRILDSGHEYQIDHGSFKGQKRREFDFVVVQIRYPGTRPLIPDIPPGLGIPAPATLINKNLTTEGTENTETKKFLNRK